VYRARSLRYRALQGMPSDFACEGPVECRYSICCPRWHARVGMGSDVDLALKVIVPTSQPKRVDREIECLHVLR
jgi:hypothetical protein